MRLFLPRFLWAVAAFLVLVVVGTAGYVLIEGVPAYDALYMTVITVTAVGYEEVFPLGAAGRNFTMALLLSGITGMGVWFALITSLLVELDLRNALRRRRTVHAIESLTDHVILCGAGRTGRQVAQELAASRAPFVVIERDADAIARLRDYLPDALVVAGDATHDGVLLQAGVDRARGLVSCLSADADNVFVVLSARNLSASLTIVARAYEEESLDKMHRAGADHVVSPNVSGAVRMASLLLRPSVMSFLDVAMGSSERPLRVEEVPVGPGSAVAERTLEEAAIPHHTGLIVIAVRKHDADDLVFNPVASTRLAAGDRVVVLGPPERIRDLQALTG